MTSRSHFSGLVLMALVLLASPPGARAGEPTLRVRARTRIELHAIETSPTSLRLRGQFLDDADQPVAGHTIAIHVERGGVTVFAYAEPTNDKGMFDQRVSLSALGTYRVVIHGRGDADYADAEPLDQTVDVARRTPVLSLSAPELVSAVERRFTVRVEARDGDAPLDLELALELDGRPLARLRTPGGTATHAFETSLLGRPGDPHVVAATFVGDAERNPAHTTRTLRLTTPTTLTLAAGGAELKWKGALPLDGELTDTTGPVAGAEVTLFAGPVGGGDEGTRPIATAHTDGRGRFHVDLAGGRLRPATWFVEARFEPSVSWREPSRSPTVAITALAPEPLSAAFYVSPIVTALVLGGFALFRQRPWSRLRSRRQAARERRTQARPQPAGLRESRPPLLSALRPASDLVLSGWVLDAGRSAGGAAPVATATVRVTSAAGQRVVAVDERGWFELDGQKPGPIEVDVAAPGYVSERFSRALPHRGELRHARIHLVPIRQRIFAAWREATRPVHPAPEAPETWTPRELFERATRTRILVGELAELTALVEEACYSTRVPGETTLAEAERLAAAVEKVL